ncbi:hypothetical protein LDENG_00271180 [Lucifuga dentata]|nr:hypothetical protein LDENG_00271180 [Lucifuga dentata]
MARSPSEEFDSFEELDDCSDSGSDFEAQIKSLKRKKGAVPVPLPGVLLHRVAAPLLGAQPPKRPRRTATMRLTSNPCSSSNPSPPGHTLQKQQPSMSMQASPRPARSENRGDQSIHAGDMYDAVRSGKTAMVVSKPSL